MDGAWIRAELETQLELGRRVGVVAKDEAEALIDDSREVGRMLYGLVRALDGRTKHR